MPRCNCGSATCSCVVQADPDSIITVAGSGSAANPIIIGADLGDITIGNHFAYTDTPTIAWDNSGEGSALEPVTVIANATLAFKDLTDVSDTDTPANGDVAMWITDHWEFQPIPSGPPSTVQTGAGIKGDGSVGAPVAARLGTAVNPPISLANIIGSHAELTMKDYGWPVLTDEVGNLRIPPFVFAGDDTVKWNNATLIAEYPFGSSVLTIPSASALPGGWPNASATILTVKRFDSGFNAGATLAGFQVWVRNTITDSAMTFRFRTATATAWSTWKDLYLPDMEDTGWVNITPASGTGTCQYRSRLGVVSVRANLSGMTSLATGTSGAIAAAGAIPAAYRPGVSAYGAASGGGAFNVLAYVDTNGNFSQWNNSGSAITVGRATVNYLKE